MVILLLYLFMTTRVTPRPLDKYTCILWINLLMGYKRGKRHAETPWKRMFYFIIEFCFHEFLKFSKS